MSDLERKHKFLTDGGTQMVENSDDELSDKERVVNRMAQELDHQIKAEKEYKQLKTKREAKKELKAK